MRRCIKAITWRQQDSLLGGSLAERVGVISARQPGEGGHAPLRPNPTKYITVRRHESLEKLQISRSSFLGPPQHNVTSADCYFRKHFSGRGIGDGEVGARVPVLLPALSVVLNHPSRAHTGNRKRL